MLPADIWLAIVEMSLVHDRRALLCVSRALYQAVLPSLFKEVKIQFGLWESLRSHVANVDVDLQTLMRDTARTTDEVMAHIISNPTFARAVRELHVLSYTFKDDLDKNETDMLIATIRAVPHLQRFRWVGNFPQLPLRVAQALSQYCPGLQDLRIPASHAANTVPQSLTFSNLTTLTIVSQLDVDNICGYIPEHITKSKQDLQRLINSSTHLLCLTIYSDLLEGISPPVFERLRELALWSPQDKHVAMLERLLPSISNLQILAIVEITEQFENIMVLLRERAHIFPNLRGFKVMSLDSVDSAPCMIPLAHFLRGQPQLEWLDVDIPGLTSSNALELLETVSHLGHLRVLGFDLRSISDEDDIPVLAAYLSPSLTALHIQIAWENTLFSSRELVDLFNRLVEMDNLDFLHVESVYTTDVEIVEELAYNLQQLAVIGLGEAIWNVNSSGQDGLSERWAVKEVALRSSRTLGETGEWLLRFHNLLGDTLP